MLFLKCSNAVRVVSPILLTKTTPPIYREITSASAKPIQGGASTITDYEAIFQQIEQDPNHHLLVAEVDGEIVGSGDLLIVPNLSHRGLPWAIVENVIVEESMRRKGIARKLMQHMIDFARRSGCYKIGLSSNKKRPDAHRMYEALGFRQYGYGYRIYF